MAVFATSRLEPPERRPRRPQAAIAQADRPEGRRRVDRVVERDLPAPAEIARRRAEGIHARLTAVDQCGCRPPVVADQTGRAIQGIPLADPPEVDADAGPVGRDGAVRGVERQVMLAGAGAGVCQDFGVGDAGRALEEAPGDREGAGRHVVGAASQPVNGLRPFQEAEKAGFDRDGAEVGRGVQEADLGVVAVDAQLRLQLADPVERLQCQGDGAGGLRGDADLEERAHPRPARLEQVGRAGHSRRVGGRRLRDGDSTAQEVATLERGRGGSHAGRAFGGVRGGRQSARRTAARGGGSPRQRFMISRRVPPQ